MRYNIIQLLVLIKMRDGGMGEEKFKNKILIVISWYQNSCYYGEISPRIELMTFHLC